MDVGGSCSPWEQSCGAQQAALVLTQGGMTQGPGAFNFSPYQRVSQTYMIDF